MRRPTSYTESVVEGAEVEIARALKGAMSPALARNDERRRQGPGKGFRTRRYERRPENKVFHYRMGADEGDVVNAWVKARAEALDTTTGMVVLGILKAVMEMDRRGEWAFEVG